MVKTSLPLLQNYCWNSEKQNKIIRDLQKGWRGDHGFCSVCWLSPCPETTKKWAAHLNHIFSITRLIAFSKKGNP